LADEVAESQKIEAEYVARTGIDGPQQTGGTQRPREREGRALGDLQMPGDLGDAESSSAGTADEVE
jgi:hypothetical protein